MPPWRLYDGNGESDSFDYYRFQMWNYIDQMHIGNIPAISHTLWSHLD